MNELVHWILHSRSLSSVRLPSLAGRGMPERLRSTAFAVLGLTAAAGLALVAIFAQLSFPLLEPAPLPDEPTASESIGEAQKARFGHGPGALVTVRPAASPHRGSSSAAGHPSQASGGTSTGTGRTAAPLAGIGAPTPVSTPEPSSGNNGGGGDGSGPGGGPSPDPTAAPEPTPTAPSTPAPAPAPKPTDSVPTPVTAAPAPEPVAPGYSSSSAAAAHASERGIEASAKSAMETPAPSAPAGNAYAKGHYKERTGEPGRDLDSSHGRRDASAVPDRRHRWGEDRRHPGAAAG